MPGQTPYPIRPIQNILFQVVSGICENDPDHWTAVVSINGRPYAIPHCFTKSDAVAKVKEIEDAFALANTIRFNRN